MALRWRDVDLAGGRLHVTGSKTDAGVRDVTLLPVLRDELAVYRAGSSHTGPTAFVFTTRDGGQCDDNHLRSRVLAKAIARANEHREAAGLTPLPEGLTFHSLRHTFVSALFALGHELPVVMAEVGHADPAVTLGIYAHVMRRGPEAKAALRALVEGRDGMAALLAGAADIAGERDYATASDQSTQHGGGLLSVAEGERGQDQRPEPFGLELRGRVLDRDR